MTYEWATKGRRRINIGGGKVIVRIVYPPRDGEVFPYMTYRGERRFALPHDSGVYLLGAVVQKLS